jgi:hypothetical protein
MSYQFSLRIAVGLLGLLPVMVLADDLPHVNRVERQPIVEASQRLIEALEYIGAPLAAEDVKQLEAAFDDVNTDAGKVVQSVLDPYCLAGVHINPESRVKVHEGPAEKELMQHGWRSFLVKVHNEAGINPELKVESPNAAAMFERGRGARQRPLTDDDLVTPAESQQRFLDVMMYNGQPLRPRLSGLELEYRIVQLYSRDAGKREAQLAFNVGQGTQDIGFRNSLPILFECRPAVNVVLGVRDVDGEPAMASFVVRDHLGRVYPNPSRRLAPDFFFHEQVYREDGESLLLPPGEFTAIVTRGPEYIPQTVEFTVKPVETQRVDFRLQRWIHLAKLGWYSGDHHVHAAGCAHYDSPTEGVGPEDMMRHILGEDLNVGCVLSWGPCWYTQKQFFEGTTHALSTPNYLMRYDVEVSGFPSSHAGHLCLLRLTEDEYPGTSTIEEWPSWTLPVLKWGKEQGAVVGYSHSGWGLALPDYGPRGERLEGIRYPPRPGTPQGRAADTLPDYAMPKFDGIGANEYIVTVAHDVCDFISAVDTPAIWELNIWYHTLNCGMTARISGETDFPCIYGDRVGLGRIYVKLDDDEPLTYDAWVQGLKNGRSYCGDGLSHIIDFAVNGHGVGEPPGKDDAGSAAGQRPAFSRVDLDEPGTVRVTFEAAALLAEEPTEQTEAIRNRRLDQKPYWHIERCRIGNTRKVPVEVIVNGQVAATQELEADGEIVPLEFDVEIPHSSWVAVRILPSVHTNPVFVHVDGKPIRASRRSAEWCRDAVDVCWESKSPRIRESEREEAKAAYEKARAIYETIAAEAVVE